MLKYLAKRIGRSILTLFVIVTLVFCLLRLMPVEGYFANYEKMTEAQIQAGLQSMGLLDPLPVQVGRFWVNALHGDLGVSHIYKVNASVTSILAKKLPISCLLYTSGQRGDVHQAQRALPRCKGRRLRPRAKLRHGQRHHLHHLATHRRPHPRRGGVLPDVANMSVLGYNLPKVYEGRGPLEAEMCIRDSCIGFRIGAAAECFLPDFVRPDRCLASACPTEMCIRDRAISSLHCCTHHSIPTC